MKDTQPGNCVMWSPKSKIVLIRSRHSHVQKFLGSVAPPCITNNPLVFHEDLFVNSGQLGLAMAKCFCN